MLDTSRLRNDMDAVKASLITRGYQLDSDQFQALFAHYQSCQRDTQDLQTQRRLRAKEVEKLVAKGVSPDEAKRTLKIDKKKEAAYDAQLAQCEQSLRKASEDVRAFMLDIPNTPDQRVPQGVSAEDNEVLSTWGKPPELNFDPKDHLKLGGKALNTELAAALAGTRFMVLRGAVARLHRALAQFMLSTHTTFGYEEIYVPYIANGEALRGTGQLPKFADDLFALSGSSDYYLIPTAEVPLSNLYANRILDYEDLAQPIKLMAHTPCFRREAGNYGRDTRGVLRQHQFDKVELVQLCQPKHADDALEALCTHAEAVLKQLELPYRKVSLCTGDLGFAACRTYDLEVWLPSQGCYREISSCSDFGTFQARRMGLRWRDKTTKTKVFAHTLNGSGVAVGRCMAAVMENHQQHDGTIKLPKALVPYMDGIREINVQT